MRMQGKHTRERRVPAAELGLEDFLQRVARKGSFTLPQLVHRRRGDAPRVVVMVLVLDLLLLVILALAADILVLATRTAASAHRRRA
jgi:hypothetical protein